MNSENKVLTSEIPASKPIYHGAEAVGRKVAFACGDVVYNLPWMLVSSFVMYFLTDVALVPAAVVSLIMLGSRVWDSINDPMIAYMADKTQTKYGRYRPWLMGSAAPFLICVILLFWAHPEWSTGARIAYAVVIYCITVIFSTAWNIPYGGLMATLTPDPTERADFASYKILFSSVTCAISSSIFMPLVSKFAGSDGNVTQGYVLATALICAMAIPFVLICVKGTKEVVHPPAGQKITISDTFKAIFTNPPLMIVVFAFLVYGFISYGRMTAAVYYFEYNMGRSDLFSVYALFNGVFAGVMAFFGGKLLKVFKSKRNAIIFSYFMMAILCVITYFLNPEVTSSNVFMVLLLGSGLVGGLSSCMIFAMVPDTVEYSQWKTGVRTDAASYAATSFALKLGGAIAPTVLAAWIAAAGYVPGAVQNAGTLTAINAIMNLVPAVLNIVGIILFLFYKLDDKMHAQIVKELKQRGQSLLDD